MLKPVLAVIAVTAALFSAAGAQEYQAMTTEAATLRGAPSETADSIGTIPAGTSLIVTVCFNEGAYCQVEGSGTMGFIAGDRMTIEGTSQTVASAERARWAKINSAPAAVFASDIVAWGDSLTEGAGTSSNAAKFLAPATSLFSPPRLIRNEGVGGETSTQIRARFFANPYLHDRITWIWAGRNNASDPKTVLADIDQMVKALGHDRYLIGSILNGDYPGERVGQPQYVRIVKLNEELSRRYGERYVDVRRALIAAAGPGDEQDVADDIVPRSLRHDQIHLNDAGYRIVSQVWQAATDRLGF